MSVQNMPGQRYPGSQYESGDEEGNNEVCLVCSAGSSTPGIFCARAACLQVARPSVGGSPQQSNTAWVRTWLAPTGA